MTLIPLSSSVDTVPIGSPSKLSWGDVQALTKSYSCAGRVATYGGGNALVSFTVYSYAHNSSKLDRDILYVHYHVYNRIIAHNQYICFSFISPGLWWNIEWHNPIKWDIAMDNYCS
jgi:hypothetical protein